MTSDLVCLIVDAVSHSNRYSTKLILEHQMSEQQKVSAFVCT